jgi:gliding motility-associated-like protein
MKTVIASLFFFFSTPVFSQNLVVDSSFEDYLTCPITFGMVYCPLAPPSWPQTLTHWFSAVPNSPDYYNSCSSNMYSTVPNNYYGNYPAHTGQAYAGIVAYGGHIVNSITSYREYIECQLTQPLVAGQKYKLSMWVNFIVHPYIMSPGYVSAATDRLAAHFSVNQLMALSGPLSNSFISIQSQPAGFLNDSSQWVNITGEYIATGGENFLTIGTFDNGTIPALQPFYPATPAPGDSYESYYFIDDVTLTTAPVVPCDTNIFIHDTIICSTEAILNPFQTDGFYTWNTGEITPGISVNTSGIYWRIATDGCNATIDTFKVQFFNGVITQSHNQSLCATDPTITLQGYPGATSYQWSTGATTATIDIQQAGTYYCRAVENCMLHVDTFHIAPFHTTTYTQDTAVCFPASIILTSINNADLYVWNNGQTTQSITVSTAGKYTCNAYKACDLFIHDFTLTSKAAISSIELGNDTTICNDRSITIGHEYPDVVSSLWNTGATNCCIIPAETGNYKLEVNNGCTTLIDDIDIEIVPCEDCIYMPTAFTPNADGKNDKLGIITKCPLYSFNLKIFNRFGELVYESKDVSGKWNGLYKGQRADLGVYFYYIQYTSLADLKEHMLKGDITLLY